MPISSSSHLILSSEYLNFKNQNLSIDVSLHIGSFIAVIFYFYKDLINFFENKFLFFKIFISSIPVITAGYILVNLGVMEKIRNLEVIAWTTFLFGLLLFISDQFKIDKNIKKDFTIQKAIFIGILQVFSLVPGVSRSGIAITAARFLNFKRIDSAKISFLISIPILGAVSIFGLKNIIFSDDISFSKINLIAIFLSFLTSFITIKYFLVYINKFSLNIFVFYRIVLGVILLFLTYL